MNIAMTTLIVLSGLVLLPAASVIPCVDVGTAEAGKAAAAAGGAEKDDALALPLCEPGAAQKLAPTPLGLPAAGGVVGALVVLLSNSPNAAVATSSTVSTN